MMLSHLAAVSNCSSREVSQVLSSGDAGIRFSFQTLIRLVSSSTMEKNPCALDNTGLRAADHLSLFLHPAHELPQILPQKSNFTTFNSKLVLFNMQ